MGNFSSIKNMLLAGGSIVINKAMAKKIGLEATVLYSELLTQYDFYRCNQQLQDGWFFATADKLTKSTTLSYFKQKTALTKLEENGLIQSRLKGIPATKYFKINENFNLIVNMLKDENKKTQFDKNSKTCMEENHKQESKESKGINHLDNHLESSSSDGDELKIRKILQEAGVADLKSLKKIVKLRIPIERIEAIVAYAKDFPNLNAGFIVKALLSNFEFPKNWLEQYKMKINLANKKNPDKQCPLCHGEGLVKNIETKNWEKCPQCKGAGIKNDK